ncbi:MAG: type I 3-dehydroquinate dehydratase [Chthoniobacterales bacterium]
MAVIFSPADLHRAATVRHPPDLFEARLDALGPFLPEAETFLRKLAAPLIITARHSHEGGMNSLSPARRRDLLLRFLPRARYVDVELRSAVELRAVLEEAEAQRVHRIISVHDFYHTPSDAELKSLFKAACALAPDIFKIVTRTDSEEDMQRLIRFFSQNKKRMAISAMGTGAMGKQSRIELARLGSALNYAHLGTHQVDGQLSLTELRRIIR